ncbi:hypothetical protein [Microvirga lenta]|uniref:hypothetical protein n=1 Tax=Microvirga lenta TaxID=2881337 RepID=UPI001CFFC7A7|nr:hypothetical protein [Microvirga lenta]MCB5176513.1 hypothetical protein [Microvirga lenta]
MNEAEVDVVAEELAKLGGTAWYPGREPGPLLRIVHERYRDRARAAIAALDRFRATAAGTTSPEAPPASAAAEDISPSQDTETQIRIGTTIIYRPEGDRRAYACTVQKIVNGFVFLVPENRTGIGWVPLADLEKPQAITASRQEDETGRNGSGPPGNQS